MFLRNKFAITLRESEPFLLLPASGKIFIRSGRPFPVHILQTQQYKIVGQVVTFETFPEYPSSGQLFKRKEVKIS